MPPHVSLTSSSSPPVGSASAASISPSVPLGQSRQPRQSSQSSQISKPLPALPPLQITSPRSPDSPISYSPSVKRKPLPASALTSPPPLPLPPLPLPLPQLEPPFFLEHRPVDAARARSVAPVSSNTLNQVIDFIPEPAVDDPAALNSVHESFHYSNTPTDANDPTSFKDLSVPLVAESKSPRPDDETRSKVIETTMGLQPGERPPPLRMDSIDSVRTLDSKKPQSPSNKFTSFFMRKPQPSPGADSAVTDISEGRSPMPSPLPPSENGSSSALNSYFNFGLGRSNTQGSLGSQDSISFSPSQNIKRTSADDRANAIEAELREISIELANSIRRELDLEDIVERLQSQNPQQAVISDRTSDYFSDSGASSLRADGSELTHKDEIDKIKRDTEQQRAQLRIDLSQKWQDEINQRKALETAFDDLRRKLLEERRARENYEDLLSALRVELEKHRAERDNYKTDLVPRLQSRIDSLEANLQHLKDENAALISAREMERGIHGSSMQFIAEEDDLIQSQRAGAGPRVGGLSRSNTTTVGRRGSLQRSGSISRSGSVVNRSGQPVDSIENAAEKLKSAEQQRDALHNTVKYLLRRQGQERKQFGKRARMLEIELDRTQTSLPQPRKGGYEREVRILRAEINTLRKRADDALDQKWQCEKNLAGLKMDLDRNKQETASLQRILQARGSDPDVQSLVSTTLENAILEMQKERARIQESSKQIQQEQHLAEQIEEYASRSEALAAQVKRQLQTNSSLRARLKTAVEMGETNQHASADQINELQDKLRKLEDSISAAQTQSETAVMKHEEEVQVLKASHNAQLMRTLSKSKNPNPNLLAPTAKSPLSPMFANSKKSPQIDRTSSGPGMALHEALRTEYLETKVSDLEKALADTESEIGRIVGKMNQAQMNVADLEAERDEALRMTRQLEHAVQDERQRYAALIKTVNQW